MGSINIKHKNMHNNYAGEMMKLVNERRRSLVTSLQPFR